MNFKNKKVTVMGLGLFGGGVGVTRFLASRGADVTVTDLKSAEELSASLKLLNGLPVRFRLGKHHDEDFSDTDILIVNPAVHENSRFLKLAYENNVLIDSELNIFFKLCTAPIIGVTGSNGKSTTTSLLGEMLKAGGIKTWVGGNIGVSLLEDLDEIHPADVVVLEISSFQLENLSRTETSPHISIITNIVPNHLDRHKTMENYMDIKKAIIHFQKEDDYAILNYDDPALRKWKGEGRSRILWFSAEKELEHGAFLKNNEIIVNHDSKKTVISFSRQVRIKGLHNIQNIMAASCAAILNHVEAESIEDAINGFTGLEHRLEYVNTINGVQYYNDSKATTQEAAIAGIKAFNTTASPVQTGLSRSGNEAKTGQVILIAGGYNKETSLRDFAQECVKNTKYVILTGETSGYIQGLIQDIKGEKTGPGVYVAESLDESVRRAADVAEAGDIVLLSPACASYDMFPNYEERGKRFKELVHRIAGSSPC